MPVGITPAEILLCTLQIQKKRDEMSKPPLNMPNLAGVTGAFDKLRDGIEARAAKFMNRIESVDAKATTVFKKGDDKLDAHEAGLAEVDGFLEKLDASLGNGERDSDESSRALDNSKTENQE